MLSSPHPSPSGQPGGKEAGRCSPGHRLLFSFHLQGLQPTPGWGSVSAARPPHGDSPFGQRPLRPGFLFTSASCGPTLKCFLPAAREARLRHTRFQDARTRLPCPRDPAPGKAQPQPPGLLTSLFSHSLHHTRLENSAVCLRASSLLFSTPKWMFAIRNFYLEQAWN